MGNRLAVLAITFAFLGFAVSAEAGGLGVGGLGTVLIGSAGNDLPPTVVASAILAEAYERAGYRAEFVPYPPNRMIASLKMGAIDAIVIAESGLEREIPGVIRIDTPLWIDELTVFSRESRRIRSWQELRGLRVGYLTAMLIIERNIPEGAERFPAHTVVQLFRMLDADRSDVVVTSRTIAKLMIAQLGLSGIRDSGETLATVLNYHFVSGGRAEAASRVSAALGDMEKSGRIAEITRVTLERLFKEASR